MTAIGVLVGPAGIDPVDAVFGNGNDVVIAGGSPNRRAKIASIRIMGDMVPTAAAGDRYGLEAEMIGFWKVAGVEHPLHPGPHNDAAIPMAPNDVALIEL